jgi:hypothetical protein
MQEKKCFKCGRILPLEDFYKHPRMKDGHLNKCKECTRTDVKRDYDRNSSNPEWVEKERERGREKYHRLGYNHKFSGITDLCPLIKTISAKLRRRGYNTNGMEAHHWNYNYPFSVFLLSRNAHRRLHQHMVVNLENKMCYTVFGEPLKDEQHAASYFRMILDTYGMKENLNVINL